MKNRDESSLINRAKAGDSTAYSQLVKLYQQQILFLIFDLTGNYQDAKDLAQDTFIRAFAKLSQFRESAGFSTWLFRIAVNLTMDFHRKRQKATIPLDELAPDAANIQYFADPARAIEQQELKTQVLKMVDRLPFQQRTVIVLKFYHGKSYPEIAQLLACSESTIRNHHARALEKLRKYAMRLQGE
ncbi:RNA polymerase sigma factor [candidate division KSB1 bacterium]|nr:RNA polymerase sigma factor [candidate division KSB1 bacterium]